MLNKRLKSRLERIDWDFAGAPSESAFSALHWHPARLPSQVAATFIGLLSDPGDTILDPFLGSGTTVIEAQRLGRSGIGFDLNPVSCLVARAKTLPLRAKVIEGIVEELKGQAKEILTPSLLHKNCRSLVPSTVQSKWYTTRVLRDLGILWYEIGTLRGMRKVLAEMSFSATLLSVCRETRHWGYVCDNSTPKTNHEGNVLSEFGKILDRIAAAYNERDSDRSSRSESKVSRVKLQCGDSRLSLRGLERASVRLIVTSPPYYGVSDYIKSQRLSMEWLEIEIEPIRRLEIGARSKRHRRNAIEEYLTEMQEIFARALPVLQPDGACVIVLGESSTRATYVDRFYKVLKKSGYDLEYLTKRNVSPQRRQYASIGTESIAVVTPA